jgi:hypothetical protein
MRNALTVLSHAPPSSRGWHTTAAGWTTPAKGEAVNTQTRTQQLIYTPRPSPVADLIRNHRDQMRAIWDRHARELQSPPQQRVAA